VPEKRHSAKAPLSIIFSERSLPGAALGKGFDKCKGSFAECPRLDPVVFEHQVVVRIARVRRKTMTGRNIDMVGRRIRVLVLLSFTVPSRSPINMSS
jgi:hypothetical protein